VAFDCDRLSVIRLLLFIKIT